MKVLVFLSFKHFVRQCCGRFLLGIWKTFEKQNSFSKRVIPFCSRIIVFQRTRLILEGTQLIFHGALGFFLSLRSVFQWKLLVFGGKMCFFNESVGLFGFKHFVRQCCRRFFPCNLKAFLKAELVFKESHTFLQQGHCLSKDSLILDGRNWFFHGALGFFVTQDRFSMKTISLLVVKVDFFNESVGLCGFKHFVRQCCGRFFRGIWRRF